MFDLSIKDYSITAGGTLRLHIPSDFFQIMEATGPVNIDFIRANSRSGYAEGVGQGFRLGPLGEGFHGVEIYSATAQTLKLCFSKGDSPVDLLQVLRVTGSVSVDNSTSVSDNSSFSGAKLVTATVGNYPYVNMRNPAGSGVVAVLESLSFSCDPAAVSVLALHHFDTALLNEFAVGVNKNIGEAGTSPILFGASNSASSFVANPTLGFGRPAGGLQDFPLPSPIILMPGRGIVLDPVYSATAAAFLTANFQYRLEAE